MKVICINGVKEGLAAYIGVPARKQDEVYEGEIYTVCGQYMVDGFLCYFLEEKSRTSAYFWKGFIPLSDINESDILCKNDNDIKIKANK